MWNKGPLLRPKCIGTVMVRTQLLIYQQHDNTQPHTACHTVKQIQELKLDMLPHLPYSSDLATSIKHLFWPLSDALHGCNFRSDEEVKEAMHDKLE